MKFTYNIKTLLSNVRNISDENHATLHENLYRQIRKSRKFSFPSFTFTKFLQYFQTLRNTITLQIALRTDIFSIMSSLTL